MMDLLAQSSAAELPLPGGSPGATVRLTPLLTAEMPCPRGWIAREGGRLAALRVLATRRSRYVPLPVPAFLVEHATAGPFVIDTGLHPSVIERPRENLGNGFGTICDVRMSPEMAVPAQLERRGLDARTLGLVVMTHLHFDHASSVVDFPTAMFLVSDAEWRAARHGGLRDGYVHRQFDHAFDWRTIDYDAPEINSYEGFSHAVDLFGDGSVRLLFTPGHTAGHQSVLLRLKEGEALVCGDAAYMLETIERDTMPLHCWDEHRFGRSLKEIQRFVQRTPSLVVIPGHDPEHWATLAESYE